MTLPVRETIRRALREGGILPEGTDGQVLTSQGPGKPPQWEAAAAGGGAGSLGVWLPDAAPASAGSLDDEFADESGGVPTGWTEFDFDTNTAITEDEHGLTMVQTTHAGDSIAGMYKTLPAGAFTVWTKVYLVSARRVNFQFAGLVLLEDGASSAGNLATYGLRYSSTTDGPGKAEWTDYNSFSSEVNLNLNQYEMFLYLRIRYDTTTFSFEWSRDGVAWHQSTTDTALGFTPAHVGLCINNVATGSDVKAVFSFFRYLASDAGRLGVLEGDRV